MSQDQHKGKDKGRDPLVGDNVAWDVMEALGQGVTIIGANDRFEYVNPALARMVGRSPEALMGLSLLDVTHPDDHETAWQVNYQRGTGKVITYETRLVRPDGTIVHAYITESPRWQGEEVVGAYAIITDLTERRRAIDESENRYRRTLDNLVEGCQIIGFDWRYLYVNNTVAAQGKQTKAGLLGKTMMEIYPGIEHTELFAVLKRCMNEWVAEQMENEFAFPDGSKGWFELRIEPVPEGIFILSFDITAQKKAEANLQARQAQLAGLIASAMDAIISIDESQHIVLFNEAAAEMFACSAAEAMGQPLERFIPERFRTVHRQHIQRFGQTGVTNRKMGQLDTLWALRADGREFPIEASISQVEHGDETLYTVILRDNSERKQTEEALRESEQKYAAIFAKSPFAMALTRAADGTIVNVNDAFLKLFDFTRAEVIGKRSLELGITAPGAQEQIAAALQANGYVTDFEAVRFTKSGGQRVLSLSVDWVSIAGERHVLTTAHDITERKQGEVALRQSETQLHHIIDSIPEGVLLLTPDGSVRLTNPVAGKFLTILAPEWESGRLTHLGGRPLAKLLTSPPTKGLWHEINLEDYSFEAIARPVEYSPENTGWVLVLRDVTQEREIQRQVQRQERLAAVGQLASGIAHDFNNIMAVIVLYAQILFRTLELPESAQEKLRTIERQAQRATDLIQQILDFSRQAVIEPRPIDLLPFMKELVKLLDRTLPEHIQIELNHAENEYIIQADPSRIQQVMMNLAVNARDAMPRGGQLQITLAHLQLKEAKSMPINGMSPGPWIHIQVADSGSGIPTELLSKIFEPFFTTKEVGVGTGLGLAQVYGIVQQHGGYIDVATTVGQGTMFSMYFPALGIGETIPLTLDKAGLVPGAGQTVLVVEDDPVTRQAIVSSLLFMNYEVMEATNGQEALTLLTEKSNDIDLVLSDTVMPKMGGIALLHAMRQQQLTTPMVLISGHPLTREMENLQKLGLAGWLPKPPHLESLSQLLAQVLRAEVPN